MAPKYPDEPMLTQVAPLGPCWTISVIVDLLGHFRAMLDHLGLLKQS